MRGPSLVLGDTHNFGRRVQRRGTKVFKPRTLFWEELLLAGSSPLRVCLLEAAAEAGLGPDYFAFLPDLHFETTEGGLGGEVEALELEPLPAQPLDAEQRRSLALVVGRSVALWSWLGVADLHWENLVVGLDKRGNKVFGPLDIELVLADLELPTETKLLPDADPEYAELCRHAAGLRRILPFLGKPVRGEDVVAMASAYAQCFALLEQHAARVARLLLALPELKSAPIRVCLRSTEEYVLASSRPPWPPLLDEELAQLARGDIPYFFRLYGQRGIHAYAEPSLRTHRTLPTKGDVPQLEPLLSLEKGLRARSKRRREALQLQGLFALIGAFDHRDLAGSYKAEGLEVEFGRGYLKVRGEPVEGGLDNAIPGVGEELETDRDLSAFVGSLYLPCSCGEVGSVFVPPTTRCATAAQRTSRAAGP